MKARVRRLWRITTWLERAITVATPIMPILAADQGRWGEAVAWFVAGLWWWEYLTAKTTIHTLTVEIRLRELMHQAHIQAGILAEAQRRRAQKHPRHDSVRFPRGHR